MRSKLRHIAFVAAFAASVGLLGCDSTLPSHRESLGVEAWIETNAPLPDIRVSSTRPTRDPLIPSPATDAVDLRVTVGEQAVTYARDPDNPLLFRPASDIRTQPTSGERFVLELDAPETSLSASGTLPPPIAAQDVHVSIPNEPISVVLVDSLVVGLDSLNLSLIATTG